MLTWLAKSALMQSPVGGLLKMVPRKVWIAIGGVLVIIAAVLWHRHEVHAFRVQVTKEVDAGWQLRLDAEHAKTLEWKQKYDQVQVAMAQDIRNRHEQTLRDSAVVADDLRMRGPGAARCGQGDHSGNPASASGHDARPGPSATALAEVLNDERVDLVGLPYTSTVNAFQQSDANLSEVKSWREWYDKLVKGWPAH